jgi:hypothetical protein
MNLGGITTETQIRKIEKEDATQMLHVYQRFTRNYVGLASGDIKSYKRLLRKKETFGWVALNKEGKVMGYIMVLFNKRTKEARIREIVVDPDENFERVAKFLVENAY